ncbi:hypothetical protein Tco_0190708 [Tanacetum coccineum]
MRTERVGMDLNAFIRTADPRKVRIVERPRAENERPIVTVAKYRTVTLLSDIRVRSPSAFGRFPSTPTKRLRADYGTTGGSVTGGKSPSVLNRLLQDSRLTVEQGVPALPTLPFITSSVTASPLEEGGDRTDSELNSVDPEVEFVGLMLTVMSEAITVATCCYHGGLFWLIVNKEIRVAPHPSVFEFFKLLRRRIPTQFDLSSRLGSLVREYNILEKRKWRSLAEEKSFWYLRHENLTSSGSCLGKDQLRPLEQECNSLKLKVTGLESTIAEKIMSFLT